ncbi:MAG: anhydro-N-acetylmuramic acid kinase [Ignavibacteria bacterium]|nr:anhydro-N-acetylmuramic acid kinase [Ignavibacteria bacterium]
MNEKLCSIIKKKERTVIGILSGTSVDSADAVLVKIKGSGINSEIRVLDFVSLPFSDELKSAVFKASEVKTSRVDHICRLNVIIGAFFSDAIFKLLKRNRLSKDQIDLIGSHGQTIHHLPDNNKYVGYKTKSTLQIGDPSVIANLTGITTVGDFRIADCAVGGDGAPLVPYLDYILFSHKESNRLLVNIGGIANITFLRAGSGMNDIKAFDTGPGNMLIDALSKIFFKTSYDRSGRLARNGSVNTELFNYLLKDSFYRKTPPKSSGRESYGEPYVKKLVQISKKMNKYDVIRTVTEFTAYSVWYNFNQFINCKSDCEIIVSGGGSKNPVIMKSLKNYFRNFKVSVLNYRGITSANKEAVLFAVLANECISGNPTNIRSVTSSGRKVILGKICQAL